MTRSEHAATPVGLGRQRPRIEALPLFHTSAGDDAVDLAASVGLFLDPWQEHVLRGSLGERADGKWASFEVGLVVPRQNGKNSCLEARELAGMFLFDEETIIHSAHEFKTAIEGFKRIEGLIRGSQLIEDVKGYRGDPEGQIAGIKTGNGNESITLKNGNSLRFMARTSGGGRGFTGDTVILDEAYALHKSQIAAMLPTMAARSITGSPQIWYTSSAGMPDSDVLADLRERGLGDDPGRLAYFEWSVDHKAKGFDPADPEQWAIANPGLGIRISEEFIGDEFRSMGAEEFNRERLGIWSEVGGSSVFPEGYWAAGELPEGEDVPELDVIALAVDVPPERSSASIVLAGFMDDGRTYGEVIDRRNGLDWVPAALKAYRDKLDPCAIVIDAGGAAGVLVPDLREEKIRTIHSTARDYAQSCGKTFDLVMQGALVHIGQEELGDAVDGARKSAMGDSLWRWSRKDSLVDISPLCGLSLAIQGLERRGRRKRSKTISSSNARSTGRKAVFL